MDKKKILWAILISCFCAGVCSFIAVAYNREQGGAVFFIGAITLVISVVGMAYCIMELDNVSGFPAETTKGGAYGKKNFSVH